jgi:hypothetical protein
MARRQADDQPADLARPHRREFRGDQFDMPVHQGPGARVELAERARGKARKVMVQQRRALVPAGSRRMLIGGFEKGLSSTSLTELVLDVSWVSLRLAPVSTGSKSHVSSVIAVAGS